MWTFKAYYSLRVAEGDELVRPDARVSLGIVDQTWVAGGLMWFAINAFDITGATAVAVRIHTELILATWTTNRRICKNIVGRSLYYLVELKTARGGFENKLNAYYSINKKEIL